MAAKIDLPKPPRDNESQLRQYEHLYKHQVAMLWLSIFKFIGILRKDWVTRTVVNKMVAKSLNARRAARLGQIYWESVVHMIDAYIQHLGNVDLTDLPAESTSVEQLISAKKTEKAVILLHLVDLEAEIAFYDDYVSSLQKEVFLHKPDPQEVARVTANVYKSHPTRL